MTSNFRGHYYLRLLCNLMGLLAIVSGMWSLTAVSIYAQTPCPAGLEWGCLEAPLPGIGDTSIDTIAKPENNPFTTTFRFIANFMVALIVAVGLIVVVVSGFVYMTAGGSGDRIGKAKTMLGGALLGITLALTAYLLLNTLSSQFTDIQEPELKHIKDAKCTNDDDCDTVNGLACERNTHTCQKVDCFTRTDCPVNNNCVAGRCVPLPPGV